MDQSIIIDVRNLTKIYKLYENNADRIKETFHPLRRKYHHNFTALNDISFQVKKGEAVGIIGRNGSGKSTLLQIICGVLQPTAGLVIVQGRVSALLELGAGFNPEFTGRENVYLSTAIMGLTREEVDAKLDRILSFAEIGEFIDQPVKLYSSGMYVRLAFATAISVDPELLIVDEALAVGDIFFQQKCIAQMKEMMSRCTIVFVTHDMHAVTNLCKRVLLLEAGRLIFEGSPLTGVSEYTKIVHTERFQKGVEALKNTQVISEKGAQGEEAFVGTGESKWIEVPQESKGGANEIEILRVKLLGEDLLPKETVIAGEILIVQMIVQAKVEKENVIFGYTVKDRVGNAIFGENTCSSLAEDLRLSSGFHLISFQFFWPEVYPETYTLTLGVGEGTDPFVHTIHCWAHNMLSISALTPGKGVHGIFNNPIIECTIYDSGHDMNGK
jgi:ABC-type polysaccharide/polyol phosphate transport system ATPase subunit